MTPEQAQDISDERLGELWRMPENYMRPISFARAVALAARSQALEEAAKASAWDEVRRSCVIRDAPTTIGALMDTMDGVLSRHMPTIATDAIRLLGEDAGRGE